MCSHTDKAIAGGHFNKHFTVAPRSFEHFSNVLTQRTGIVRRGQPNHQLLGLPLNSFIQRENIFCEYSSSSVFSDFNFARNQNRRALLQSSLILVEGLWPEDTFDRATLILQAQNSKAASLLGGAQLKIRDQACDPRRRASFQRININSRNSTQVGNLIGVVIKRMTGNIKTQSLLFRP